MPTLSDRHLGDLDRSSSKDLAGISVAELFPQEKLIQEWESLNIRYFSRVLSPITITWSPRLTASLGVFVYQRHHGPAPRVLSRSMRSFGSIIRLSTPLFASLVRRPQTGERELRRTLAHEMIHQWQAERLHIIPNHGPTFVTVMERMNEDGCGVSIYHSWRHEVEQLSRHAWVCDDCGLVYRRQRRTISPRYHRCGKCHGTLRALPPCRTPITLIAPGSECLAHDQLALPFCSIRR